MKLHELKPAEAHAKYAIVLVVVLHPVTVKLQVVAKKVKRLVAKYVWALKVDKCHCSVVCQNVVSITLTARNMLL